MRLETQQLWVIRNKITKELWALDRGGWNTLQNCWPSERLANQRYNNEVGEPLSSQTALELVNLQEEKAY